MADRVLFVISIILPAISVVGFIWRLFFTLHPFQAEGWGKSPMI